MMVEVAGSGNLYHALPLHLPAPLPGTLTGEGGFTWVMVIPPPETVPVNLTGPLRVPLTGTLTGTLTGEVGFE